MGCGVKVVEAAGSRTEIEGGGDLHLGQKMQNTQETKNISNSRRKITNTTLRDKAKSEDIRKNLVDNVNE
jgi:hypothetical protein